MKKILVTGCGGFIGSNFVSRHLKSFKIIGIDNLSRKSSKNNIKKFIKNKNFTFIKGDIRKYNFIKKIFLKHKNFYLISHQAGQVAVTTSLLNPREDFESNLLGTFNLLEATRKYSKNSIFQFSSTNKVYGDLKKEKVALYKNKYILKNKKKGVSENQKLNFLSPYGCSKGAADQYVLDYSRVFGIRATVFRQSCIYGISQIGVEDQGWVSWILIAAILNKRINIFGDGFQARDILWVDDLIDAYIKAYKNIKITNGEVYNIGGGKKNILSIKEVLDKLKKNKIDLQKPIYKSERKADQKIFCSDNSKIFKDLNWLPKVSKKDGINRLLDWIIKNKLSITKSIK